MEDLFAQASLCYLCDRCDEGFRLICSSLKGRQSPLDEEEQRVFCLLSMRVIEQRYRSWIRLHRRLIATDQTEERRAIVSYIDVILDDFHCRSNEVLLLIGRLLLDTPPSSESLLVYLEAQGDIHRLVCQTCRGVVQMEHFHLAQTFYNRVLHRCDERHYPTSHPIRLSVISKKALVFLSTSSRISVYRTSLVARRRD